MNGVQIKLAILEWPGLTDLRITQGVPEIHGAIALVEMTASWKLNGVEDRLDCLKCLDEDARVTVRVNEGMGLAAISEKAKWKLYQRIYERLTGKQ